MSIADIKNVAVSTKGFKISLNHLQQLVVISLILLEYTKDEWNVKNWMK